MCNLCADGGEESVRLQGPVHYLGGRPEIKRQSQKVGEGGRSEWGGGWVEELGGRIQMGGSS